MASVFSSIPLTLVALSGGTARLVAPPAPSASIKNLGLAGSGFVVGEQAVFGVDEGRQERDFNGDGDRDDVVLHVWEFGSDKAWNLGLSTPLPVPGGPVSISERLVVAPVREDLKDLNGDGDRLDAVLHVADLATRRITNLHLAAAQTLLDGDLVAFLVPEFSQGEGT